MARAELAAVGAAPAKPEFAWDDPLLLDEQLSEDERMVRDAARDYCQEQLMPRVLEANRHERFDPEILDEMGIGASAGLPLQRGDRGCDAPLLLPDALHFGERSRAFLKIQHGCRLAWSYCIIPTKA